MPGEISLLQAQCKVANNDVAEMAGYDGSVDLGAIAVSQGVSFMSHIDIKDIESTVKDNTKAVVSTTSYLFNMSNNLINHKNGPMSQFMSLRHQVRNLSIDIHSTMSGRKMLEIIKTIEQGNNACPLHLVGHGIKFCDMWKCQIETKTVEKSAVCPHGVDLELCIYFLMISIDSTALHGTEKYHKDLDKRASINFFIGYSEKAKRKRMAANVNEHKHEKNYKQHNVKGSFAEEVEANILVS